MLEYTTWKMLGISLEKDEIGLKLAKDGYAVLGKNTLAEKTICSPLL